MKTLPKKLIRNIVVFFTLPILFGCGGGGNGNSAKNAIDVIADYADSNTNPTPTALDYQHAGITNVIEGSIIHVGNLAAVNAMVDKGIRSDYDTVTEVQALVDLIGPKAVLDRNFGDGIHDFIYGIVRDAALDPVWLNNNLGARYADSNDPNFNPQQQATSPTDFLAYGSLFQWGRQADGHELINWTGPTTGTPKYGSTTIKNNKPSDSLFIRSSGDWRTVSSDTLWKGAAAVNNVCPIGYRIPDRSDMMIERYSWSTGSVFTIIDAFASKLALTIPGLRKYADALVTKAGSRGYYWLSDTIGANAYFLDIDMTGSSISNNSNRSWGMTVRCRRYYP